jgi:hypothetical protein
MMFHQNLKNRYLYWKVSKLEFWAYGYCAYRQPNWSWEIYFQRKIQKNNEKIIYQRPKSERATKLVQTEQSGRELS